LKIKKIDISSILPIIVDKIKLIFEDVNRLEKFIFFISNISEFTVLVKVNIDNLKDFCKERKIQSIGLSDTSNLCGALEFAENISKVRTQPIIGTQINFKFEDTIGLIPLIALNDDGYKRIMELGSRSYIENDALSEPHCDISELYKNVKGVVILSGSIQGFFGKLFDKGRFSEIHKITTPLTFLYNSDISQ
jgi:DNA polymerase-3 subunit alpha